jgi:cytochrome b pre-mRNA-processing protein 3
MISLPFRRYRREPTIDVLYGTIVAQARSTSFYRDYGVPDTVGGRLDMIILHLVLVLRQLAGNPEGETGFGQRLFARFCRDIDDNFREMGIGDLAVPKEMRRVAEAFYGRSKAYEGALAGGSVDTLAEVVARNVYGCDMPTLGSRRLAAYMMKAASRLGAQETGALVRGEIGFPDPECVGACGLEP